MHLRLTEVIGVAVGVAVGAAIAPGVLSGDVGRLLVTFLGLVSASILPTISLILGCMTASGRSVQAINRLEVELATAMDALFFLFGLVGLSVGALIALAIPQPTLAMYIPFANEILPRCGQALVIAASAWIVIRAGYIPGILRRTLKIRHEIAVDEARRKTLEGAPNTRMIKEAFAIQPDFGKSIPISDFQGPKRH